MEDQLKALEDSGEWDDTPEPNPLEYGYEQDAGEVWKYRRHQTIENAQQWDDNATH